MSRLGTSLAVGGIAFFIFYSIEQMLKFMFRHPILTTVIVIFMSIFVWLDDIFIIRTLDARTLMNMSQSEYAERYDPVFCENRGYTYCSYGNVKVSFLEDKPERVEYAAHLIINRDFTNSEDFYRYVLARLQLPYKEPDIANVDMIVWHNVGGISEITLTSSASMAAEKLILDRW